MRDAGFGSDVLKPFKKTLEQALKGVASIASLDKNQALLDQTGKQETKAIVEALNHRKSQLEPLEYLCAFSDELSDEITATTTYLHSPETVSTMAQLLGERGISIDPNVIDASLN